MPRLIGHLSALQRTWESSGIESWDHPRLLQQEAAIANALSRQNVLLLFSYPDTIQGKNRLFGSFPGNNRGKVGCSNLLL